MRKSACRRTFFIFNHQVMAKILIYGYGNPGRQDDGLGPQCALIIDEWIQKEMISNIFTDSNYQLNIEDAAEIANYDIVIFADASVVDIQDYKLEEVLADDASIEFTMHAVSPAYVLDLCRKIYGKEPKTYVLHIKGYEFDFIEELTEKSRNNLEKACEFIKEFVKSS